MNFDPIKTRSDFPIFNEEINEKPLVYLDNASTTQKPRQVIESMNLYYETQNSNIHRGVHTLSQKATEAYENARKKVQHFLKAAYAEEIIFVRSTTEAINLVAQSYGKAFIHSGDEILVSRMEHHSNIVPWQILCQQVGAHLKVIPINNHGEIILEEYHQLITPKTKLVAVTHISNSLGTINPIQKIIELAHYYNIPVLIDGAQAVAHQPVDVQALDCDFYAFSGHKIYGPTGIGVLYGKKSLLDSMPPYQGGGDMILSVSFEKTTYNVVPFKFEAGTPHIAGAIGLGAALDYLQTLDWNEIYLYENELLEYATQQIQLHTQSDFPIQIIGTASKKASILSFILKGIHPHDIGTILDQEGVAIRTGHHCTQPLMKYFGLAATARASFAFYNTKQDVQIFCTALQKVREIFYHA